MPGQKTNNYIYKKINLAWSHHETGFSNTVNDSIARYTIVVVPVHKEQLENVLGAMRTLNAFHIKA